MKFSLSIVSKVKRLFIPSPSNEKAVNWGNPLAELDYKSKPVDFGFGPDFGSKEEIFFDSRAWLDSDCEDDFYSVNGDFTPRGSTPNYQNSTAATPQRSYLVDAFPDTKSEPSPTERKKKLSELLEENLRNDQVRNEQNAVTGKVEIHGKQDDDKLEAGQPLKSLDGTPYLSGANSVYSNEATPNGDPNHRKEKMMKSKNCCLPSFIPSLGCNERRKQKMSPDR